MSHAWAVGEIHDGPTEGGGIMLLSYQWWRSDNFTMNDKPVQGARFVQLGVTDDGQLWAWGWGPLYGETERREVQQYGRETRSR